MPAIVPGWEACLCRCHRRRRRKRALSPPFLFPYRTILTSPTRVTPPSSSRAPRRRPARSRSTRARTRTAHTSPAPRPPRRTGHRAHARRATPGRSRARTVRRRRPELCRGGQEPFQATQGGKNPSLTRIRARRFRHDQIWALDYDLAPSPATLAAPPPTPSPPLPVSPRRCSSLAKTAHG
jgi:hypothetical protein